MASNGSCFMVTWIVFENHLLEVSLTQNRWETMALRTLTTVDILCFIMCEDTTWIEIHWNSIWLRVRSHVTSHYTWGSHFILRDIGGVLGRPLYAFLWALIISWSQLLARVWSGPKGLFTPWTMKSSQGLVKIVIGCWTRPGATTVRSKEKMSEWSWSSRPLKDIRQGLHYSLTWSKGYCGGRGKRDALVEKGKGPQQRNNFIIIFWWTFFLGGG